MALADVVYVGNDLNDVERLKIAGHPVAVADVYPEARSAARLILTRPGGRGAVRELAELLLAAKSYWSYMLIPLTQVRAIRRSAPQFSATLREFRHRFSLTRRQIPDYLSQRDKHVELIGLRCDRLSPLTLRANTEAIRKGWARNTVRCLREHSHERPLLLSRIFNCLISDCMVSSFVSVCECEVDDLPLAGLELAEALRRVDGVAGAAGVMQPEVGPETLGFAIGLGVPVAPLDRALAGRWLVYAGDALQWPKEIASALQAVGADFVLSERYPEEWPDRLSDHDRGWLLAHWIPLPVFWGETESTTTFIIPSRWQVVMPAHEKCVGEAPDRVPALPLVWAGLAEEFRLGGPCSTWSTKFEQLVGARDTGIVAAALDPVVNLWLWAQGCHRGVPVFVAFAGSCATRWLVATNTELPTDDAAHRLRPFMSRWFRKDSLRPSPTVSPSRGTPWHDWTRIIWSEVEDAVPGWRSLRSVRDSYRGWNPMPDRIANVQTLWKSPFWRAALSSQERIHGLAAQVPQSLVRRAARDAVSQITESHWNLFCKEVHCRNPGVWALLEHGFALATGESIEPLVYAKYGSGLFFGAADGLAGAERAGLVACAAAWHAHAEQGSSGKSSPESRAGGLPVFLATGAQDAAEKLWATLDDALTPVQWSTSLWRSFWAWLPWLEAGRAADIPESGKAWWLHRLDSLERLDGWDRPLLVSSVCRRLYFETAAEAIAWIRQVHEREQCSTASLATLALWFWLRGEDRCGAEVLDLSDAATLPEAEVDWFPVFCARALLTPERAHGALSAFARIREEFFAASAPAHTRCFFAALALAALGEHAAALQWRDRAMREDPLAGLRQRHFSRVGLKPGSP